MDPYQYLSSQSDPKAYRILLLVTFAFHMLDHSIYSVPSVADST